MDTDQKSSELGFSMTRIRSLGIDLEHIGARPDSGLENPGSSVFICGALLRRHG
jgi:hypothetical protein